MARNEEIDQSLLEFARKIAAIPKGISAGNIPPALADKSESGSESLKALVSLGNQPDRAPPIAPLGSRGKQLRNVDEIASLIMKTLRTIENCPDRGFVVTVYGSNPWNAMLTIRPEAGPRINLQLWCSRVREIGVQLRNEFDVADIQTA
jgi:hypothetical protein